MKRKEEVTKKNCNIRHKYYRVHSANITTHTHTHTQSKRKIYTYINIKSLVMFSSSMFVMISAWQSSLQTETVYNTRVTCNLRI